MGMFVLRFAKINFDPLNIIGMSIFKFSSLINFKLKRVMGREID